MSTRIRVRRIDGEWVIHIIEPETDYVGVFVLYEPFFNESPDRYNNYYLPPLFNRDDIIVITGIDGPFSFTQNGIALANDRPINNVRINDPNNYIHVTYHADRDTENVALGRLRYTANSNLNSGDAINEGNPGSGEEEPVEDELLFVIRRDFTPDDIDTDNTIDHCTIIVPETLVTGAGKDTIIPGRLDDIITPGLDDDTIDLSSDDSDFDEIIYTFTLSGSMLVAFDGGDRITGFIPGQDEIRFVDQAEMLTTPEALLAKLREIYGMGFVAVPKFEKTPVDAMLSRPGREDQAFWANYLVTGLEIHFADALVLASGRLTGSILTIVFDPTYAIRADIFISKGGTGFDAEKLKFTDIDTVITVLDNDLGWHDATREDVSRPQAMQIVIHENHPENKPVLTLEPLEAWAKEGAWSLPATPGILSDEVLLAIREGKLWWEQSPNFEDPKDGWGNNRYQLLLRYTEPDAVDGNPGQQHDRWLDIEVLDIAFERPGGWSGLFNNIDFFEFEPKDIPVEDRPELFVQYLISGLAWRLPETGPLTLTWSLATPEFDDQSQLDSQQIIDLFREDLERAFAEFKAAANLRFIEVAHTSSGAGDLLITLGPTSSPILGFARLPNPDPIVVIREQPPDTEGKPWHYNIVVHEIAHAVGLHHPFPEEGIERPWPVPSSQQHRHSDRTIMSYASPAQRTQEGLYQADIDALQFLYGAPGTDFDGVESLITTMIEYL